MRARSILLLLALSIAVFSLECAHPRHEVHGPGTGAADQGQYHNLFEKRVVEVTDGVYVAIGYALANSIMVVVDDGKVIIDTTESVEAAAEIKERFDAMAPGPVLAIVYTHTHPDHIMGASVFHEPGAPIWAHAQSMQELNNQLSSLGTTLRRRASKQYGEGLAPGLSSDNGIGPLLRLDQDSVPPVLYPTHTFSGSTILNIGGVEFVLREAPGETHDQIFIWLPEKKVLFPGDDIYMAFPNLYSTRGVSPRPVRRWIQSLDEMRALKPDFLVPSHTAPIIGADEVYDTLTVYRDAIEFVHDSVIRLANQGLGPDDMVELIKLPPHLASHPYLQESYGKVSWSLRGIFDGYMGWFDGNPTSLDRLHPRERAARMIPMMGGREKILSEIGAAIHADDLQWAAELSDVLLAQDPDDADARAAKAEAIWRLGLKETNPNARCFLLTSALELRGEYQPPKGPSINYETIKELPIDVIIRSFPERLDSAKTADVVMTVGFEFTDTGRNFTFDIRRSVGEVEERAAMNPDLKFFSTEADFKAFIVGDLSPIKALVGGRVRIDGGLSKLLAFKSYLLKP